MAEASQPDADKYSQQGAGTGKVSSSEHAAEHA